MSIVRCISVLILFTSLILATGSAQPSSPDGIWSDVAESAITENTNREIIPQSYRTLALNLGLLRQVLSTAPMEFTPDAENRTVVLDLPLPDGSFSRFRIEESPIMEPELAVKYPEIRTYIGKAMDDRGLSVRFDLTPAGFHAYMFTLDGSVYIDPYSRGNILNYISYHKRELVWDPTKSFICEGPIDETGAAEEIKRLVGLGVEFSGTQLRTYRTAVAATGEYTTFHGGTVAAGLAAVVTAMNRVNGIYEREVAVRMVLVANNNLIIYTNAATDPYTNGTGDLGPNQTNLDNVIGTANYDIGHLVGTGGGGVANLGVPCRAGWKARGLTGSPSPVGDPFYVDYVAHEMGHQFGANHTFNGSSGNCSGGNRNASTAYEPGSGSTIMAYAGICSPQDIQNFSDDYFHLASLLEIVAYTTVGLGNGCPVTTGTGNSFPVVSVPPGGFTIPVNTPFELTGSATDANGGDVLTYCWEEYDLGNAGHPNSPVGTAPIFRSFLPASSPTRSFPKLSDILGNTQTMGEILPGYTRNLNFRLVVRDNRANGGGVAYNSVAFSATGAAGPFLVTSPNTAVSWAGNSSQSITWSIANTNASPVNVSQVNIRLSTNGGNTFPITLASNTPNDGAQIVTMPNIGTTQARVRVEAVGNVFFDLSNTNFTIIQQPLAAPVLLSPPDHATGQPVSINLIWGAVETATWYRLQMGTDSTFVGGLIVNDSTLTDTSYALAGLSVNTMYFWRAQGRNISVGGTWSGRSRFTTIALPPAVSLVSPADNATEQQPSLTAIWNAAAEATSYRLQIATDSLFTSGFVVDDSTLTDTSFAASGLLTSTVYFWRVRGSNVVGDGAWSVVRKFTTVTPPAAVSLVFPEAGGTGLLEDVQLLWNQISTAESYKVQVGTDSTFSGGIVTDDSTTTDTSYAVNGLSFSETYYWRVKASNIAGVGPWMMRMFSTLFPPVGVSLVFPGDEATDQAVALELVWNESPAAATYHLQLSTDSTFAGGMVVDDSTVTDTLLAVAGLDPETTYYWRVEASNAAGSSGWSSTSEFTTASLPGVATLVSPSNGAEMPSGTVALTWTGTVPEATVYWVEWSEDSSFATSEVDSTITDTTALLPQLSDSTAYFWRVRGGNQAGWGAFSDVRMFTTLFKVEVCVPIAANWNIVSLPVGTDQDSVHTLFPDCGPQPAYAFVPGSGYQERHVLEPGTGYWVKCTSGPSCITGTPIMKDSIAVVEGWNLIGTVSKPVDAVSVTTVPPGILDSPFYKFEDGYVQSNTIEPGAAYWIKVSEDGVIVLEGQTIVVARSPENTRR